jgi:2-hydroxy-6-oxonona-2,4-dienedioate hydrolase
VLWESLVVTRSQRACRHTVGTSRLARRLADCVHPRWQPPGRRRRVGRPILSVDCFPRMTIRRSITILSLATGLLVVALAGLTLFSFQRDIKLARARITHRSDVVSTPCGLIEYAIAGAGPPVLIVHGAGGGFDQGVDFGAPAVARGFRLIAMSRFGYLRTPLPADASAEAQADAHACLLDALGIKRAAVIGASAGAPSAMQFALRHPERIVALVLAVPAAYVPRPDAAPSVTSSSATRFLFDTALRSDFLFWAAERLSRRTVIEFILGTPPELVERASTSEQQRIQRTMDHILPVTPRRNGLLNDRSVTMTLPRFGLEHIAAPTLVISCKDDRYGTFDGAQYSAAHIPTARFLGYASGGHLWVGHADEVESEIATFLTQSFSGGAPAPGRSVFQGNASERQLRLVEWVSSGRPR